METKLNDQEAGIFREVFFIDKLHILLELHIAKKIVDLDSGIRILYRYYILCTFALIGYNALKANSTLFFHIGASVIAEEQKISLLWSSNLSIRK